MASLVEQIFAQSRAGSAEGQGFGDAFFQGRQLSQNQQRISLAERQLASEVAMQPLKQTLMLQDARMNEAKLATFLEDRQNVVNNQQAYQQLTSQVSQALAGDNPETAEVAIWDAISKNRGLERVPGVGTLLEDVRSSMAGKLKLAELRKAGSQDEIGDTMGLMRAAEAKGDTELAEFYRGRLVKLSSSTGSTVRVGPDGTVELIQGPIGTSPDALTKANQNKVQESQAAAISTIDIANRLEPLISSETVGLRAFAESVVKDRLLAQVFPEVASSKRATAEQMVANLRASAIRSLRSDSNITKSEYEQIIKIIPGISEPLDSPARAKTAIAGIRKMAAIQAMVASKRMGTDVPKSAALVLGEEDLFDLFNQGLITLEMAKRANELRLGR